MHGVAGEVGFAIRQHSGRSQSDQHGKAREPVIPALRSLGKAALPCRLTTGGRMRTKLMQLGTAAAIATLVAVPSFAQTSTSPTNSSPPTSSPATSTPGAASDTGTMHKGSTTTSSTSMDNAGKSDEVRVSKLVGATVYNDQNQSVGTVDDILLAHDSKQPDRAVISVGGFLGIGSKLVEVNYDQLKLEANNKVVMPNASKDQLKGMQEFSYNTLAHSGTTNASSASSSTSSGAGTSTGSRMGSPSGTGSSTTTPSSTTK
jgi:sporulation protein YlmC with PRC-barrel domain